MKCSFVSQTNKDAINAIKQRSTLLVAPDATLSYQHTVLCPPTASTPRQPPRQVLCFMFVCKYFMTSMFVSSLNGLKPNKRLIQSSTVIIIIQNI